MNEFAIIIPNYNQSHFLPTALNSLKVQSVPLSTAVMDGGSSDQFEEVIRAHRDVVTFFRSHPDDGQSAAINEGSQKIKGKYISWLNADDYLFPYTLSYVKKTFDNNPGIDIVYGDAIHVDTDCNFLSYFPPARKFDYKELAYNSFICQPACFVRSEAFFKVGGVDSNLHYTMDWDLWCRLAQRGYKFLYVPRPLAAVRYYPETKTLGGNYKRFVEIYRIEKNYGNRILKRSWLGAYFYGLTLKRKRRFIESACFYLLKLLYESKQFLHRTRRSNGDGQLLYGFNRWQTLIEGKCEIHFPWFGINPWSVLRLQLDPIAPPNIYEVYVNGVELKNTSKSSAYLVFELDASTGNYARIRIENIAGKPFQLNSFRVECA